VQRGPPGFVGARVGDLDPVEITSEVRAVTAGARTADAIAAAVIARYGDPEPGEGNSPLAFTNNALGAIVVDIDALDDSITSEGYAVWYRPADDGTLVVERAYRITSCSRGVAALDLCV
jgi:hypothetical protein